MPGLSHGMIRTGIEETGITVCDACHGLAHPDESTMAIRNAEMLSNTVAAHYETIISPGESSISGIPEHAALGLASVNAQVAVAKELALLRKSIEMMFLGGASVLATMGDQTPLSERPYASDESQGDDDAEHTP